MSNPYNGHHPSRYQSWTDCIPVTPNDDADLPPNIGFRVGGAGDVVCETWDGGPENLRTLSRLAGEKEWGAVRKIRATGTTATGIEIYTIQPPETS